VTAAVYWSPPATLATPDLWTLIGETKIANVPSGDVLTASDAIVWPAAAIPASGHYCFIALIGNVADPAPSPTRLGTLTWDQYLTFIRNNNNVAWRNFNVIENQSSGLIDLSDWVAMEFIAPGPPDESREMRLEAVARLPKGSRAVLEIPLVMYQAMQERPSVDFDEERRTAFIPINPHGLRSLGNMLFIAKSRAKLRLLVHIPEERRHLPYEVFVRQVYKDLEVGRITWRLVPRRAEPDQNARHVEIV
jgi:hypothetical protein